MTILGSTIIHPIYYRVHGKKGRIGKRRRLQLRKRLRHTRKSRRQEEQAGRGLLLRAIEEPTIIWGTSAPTAAVTVTIMKYRFVIAHARMQVIGVQQTLMFCIYS